LANLRDEELVFRIFPLKAGNVPVWRVPVINRLGVGRARRREVSIGLSRGLVVLVLAAFDIIDSPVRPDNTDLERCSVTRWYVSRQRH
jgi:hypothetical protein